MTAARATVELTQDLCDGVYDVEAFYPNQPGENLPFAQTLFEYAANEQLPLRYALEKGLGIENPEDMLVEIAVERLLKSPQGQSMMLGYAAQDAQDSALSELEKAMAQGLATPDATPTAALGGTDHLTGAQASVGGAQQQLAGIVGGAMGTQAINNDARGVTAAQGMAQ